ncbi:TraM recognition domain-containing protein [Actinoplanes missouriensis]|uniref:type IV secretory system conjugative DNA transfer family protein n=1 Tax=Actinoplanes missouriensis TaxID=1866 RepID=UPI0033F99963
MSGSRPPQDTGPGDTLLNLVLGLFAALVAVAAMFHLAVRAAAALTGHDPAIRFGDTVTAVRTSPFDPLAGYPAGVQGDLPPALLVWPLAIALAAVPAGLLLWWRLRRAATRQPDGLATRAQLRSSLLAGAAVRRARQVRPSLAGAKRPDPGSWAMFLGNHPCGPLYAQHEDSTLLIGPPRMGKTMWFAVGAILDAPGAVVATSTKAELVRLTATARGSDGRPIHVFDPEDIAQWPDQLRWSPVDGCEDPGVASERSRAFVAAVPLGQSAKNADFFTQGADTVLRCLLHAAALAGKTMREVSAWAADFDNDEPLNILRGDDRAAPGWHGALRTFTRGAADTVSSTKMTLGLILKPLASPRVMAAVTPPPGEGLDVEQFLAERGTLYLLSEGDDGSTAPFVTALADHIVKVAKRVSQRRPQGRLDPPLRLVLDEAANVAPLPNLAGLMSDSGGRGLTLVVVLQSPDQGRNRWGDKGYGALWAAATAKMVLGGLADANDLEQLSRLCGERRIRRTSTTRAAHQSGSVTESEERERVLPPEKILTMPVGEALLFYRNMPPALVRLRPWWNRSDAAAIRAAQQEGTPA